MIASKYGHNKTVNLLLKKGAHINPKDNKNVNALIAASREGQYKTLELLIHHADHLNMF